MVVTNTIATISTMTSCHTTLGPKTSIGPHCCNFLNKIIQFISFLWLQIFLDVRDRSDEGASDEMSKRTDMSFNNKRTILNILRHDKFCQFSNSHWQGNHIFHLVTNILLLKCLR